MTNKFMEIGLPKNVVTKSKLSRAFTLVEIMLVVAILGVLAALVIPRIAGESEHTREIAARSDITGGIKTALDHYNVDMGTYPASLQDLLAQPSRNAANWRGPYLDPAVLPKDPWKNLYLYTYPGKHSTVSYDLWSAGPDGKSGDADDIGNWQTQ
jgi:general secretion pathway protein G